MTGHYCPNKKSNNEVWGLAVYKDGPHKDKFITCSDDATLRVWDSNTRKQYCLVHLNKDEKGNQLPIDKKTLGVKDEYKGRSVTISPDGKYIAVGMKTGPVIILDSRFKILRNL